MIFKTAEELLDHIHLGIPLPIYLIYGNDSARKRKMADALTKFVIGEKRGAAQQNAGLPVFHGSTPADTLADAAFEISFDGGRRCVVAEDLPLEKQSPVERGKLEQFVTELCGENCATVIFLYNIVDAEPKKDKKKLEKYTSFRKLIEKKGGGIIRCEPYTTAELCRLAEAEAQTYGTVLDRSLAYDLVARCGTDSAVVRNEAKKVAEYTGSGNVTAETLTSVTCATPDVKIYDLANQIQNGNAMAAFSLIEELCTAGEEPSSILASLAGAYVDLFRAKSAAFSGKSKADMVKDWPQSYAGREFVADRAIRGASSYSRTALFAILDALLSADRQIKSTGVDSQIVLERAVGELFLIGRGN